MKRRPGELRDAIVDLLGDGVVRSAAQVADGIGVPRAVAKEALGRLVARGTVARDTRVLPITGAPRAARAYTLLRFADRLPRGDNPWPVTVRAPRPQREIAATGARRRPRGALQAAILELLADGRPRATNEIREATGTTAPGIRTALQQAARRGVIARDRRERHMGRYRERLWTLPQFEHLLPEADRPWFEG